MPLGPPGATWACLGGVSYPLSEHAERLILAETVFNSYALAYLLKSMSYPVSEHAERLILAETIRNFHASAYAGDCSQICIS